ncbi:MAG TPA: hypothetical protein PLK46_05475 [Propioniciclava sp.]|uniref:hypothetical protein n=1 Tax=Propioniciclava sp. TaxID=2038686 RepID=UPI002C9C95CE|nr:hypothetical protein [Propioniciclava sp.]HRL49814.1 hypothetical protein [Propioniciclava sp.]HRL79769.1 hypothetical protein [Propioniciclava sp.]
MTSSTPEQRRADALRMAAMAEGAKRGEAQAAQVLIDGFVATARERGIAPEPLVATQLDGRRVRTDKVGWYVNNKKSVAVGESGEWFVLTVPSSTWGRLRGVKLEPSLPELVVGRGGRDGESGDLADFLQRMLERAT